MQFISLIWHQFEQTETAHKQICFLLSFDNEIESQINFSQTFIGPILISFINKFDIKKFFLRSSFSMTHKRWACQCEVRFLDFQMLPTLMCFYKHTNMYKNVRIWMRSFCFLVIFSISQHFRRLIESYIVVLLRPCFRRTSASFCVSLILLHSHTSLLSFYPLSHHCLLLSAY